MIIRCKTPKPQTSGQSSAIPGLGRLKIQKKHEAVSERYANALYLLDLNELDVKGQLAVGRDAR